MPFAPPNWLISLESLGSNPTLSASSFIFNDLRCGDIGGDINFQRF